MPCVFANEPRISVSVLQEACWTAVSSVFLHPSHHNARSKQQSDMPEQRNLQVAGHTSNSQSSELSNAYHCPKVLKPKPYDPNPGRNSRP